MRLASRGDGVRSEVLAALSFLVLLVRTNVSGKPVFHLASLSPLKMEAAGSTEILVTTYETAWCFNPKDYNLY